MSKGTRYIFANKNYTSFIA